MRWKRIHIKSKLKYRFSNAISPSKSCYWKYLCLDCKFEVMKEPYPAFILIE